MHAGAANVRQLCPWVTEGDSHFVALSILRSRRRLTGQSIGAFYRRLDLGHLIPEEAA